MRRLTFETHRLALAGLVVSAALLGAQTPAQKQATKEVRALFKQADEFTKKDNKAEAKRLLEQALKKADSAAGPSSKLAATAALRLGRAHVRLGEFAQAEPLFQRSLKVREKELGAEHLQVAAVLSSLGNLYLEWGRYSQAETPMTRCLELREKKQGNDHVDVARALHNLGWLYNKMGRHAKAEPLFLRALAIREAKRGKDHTEVAETLNVLGLLYRDMGHYDKSEQMLIRSLRIREAKYGKDDLHIATILNNLALLYAQLGQTAKAQLFYTRSLQIREAKLGKDHPEVGQSLNNLALLYVRLGKPKQAEPLYRQAIAIYEKKLGPDHPSLAYTLNNLAILLSNAGQYDKALPLHQRALAIREGKLGKDHPLTAAVVTSLGSLYWDLGQYDKAEQMYRRSLQIREAKLGKGHPLVAASLNSLGLVYQLTSQDAKAGQALDLSRRVQRHHLTRVLPALAEREQLSLLSQSIHGSYPTALSYGLKHGAEADKAELSAGWLLNGKGIGGEVLSVSSLMARDNGNPALGKLAKELREAREQLARLSVTTPRDGEEAAHVKQMQQLTNREQELARLYRASAGLGSAIDDWVELREVRKGLSADAVLIDVARFGVFDPKAPRQKRWQAPRYAAWVTPAKGRVRVVDLGPARAIDAALRGVLQALKNAPAEIRAHGEPKAEQALREPLRKLSDLVVKPLLPHVGQAKRWVVSPDGNLWLLPWEILLLADGKYAVEKHAISYVMSGRDVIPSAPFQGKVTRPAVFADPDFNLDPSLVKAPAKADDRPRAVSNVLKLGSIKDLPGTRLEAKGIEKSLPAYTKQSPAMYLGAQALEGTVKGLKNPRVLVLSTHGFFLPVEETKPHESSSSDEKPHLPPGTENPLLRCGLLLAGCNKSSRATSSDDGVLTGLEVASLDLRGCEMVVLSACETGVGDIRNGEGVAGLRQAFRLAGAESVVSTLWQVPDKASAELMALFFRGLAKKLDRAEALRQARLRVIAERRDENAAAHPFFWAAFTLTGR
jgi:CHAT domain-containing protein/Tfp pilus assembly protein PilF